MLNNGFTYRDRLGCEAEGLRLVDYLARRYAHSTESEWAERIRSGAVRLDAEATTPDAIVHPGQALDWHRPPWIEPAAPGSCSVLLEDSEIVAVAKPAGLPTLPGGGFLETTLLHRVRGRLAGATPVHRLGRWTSGVVLLARTALSRRDLARQFAERRVAKRYRALAAGSPVWTARDVTTPIGRVPHRLLQTVWAAAAGGKSATSHLRVVRRVDAGFVCDVRIRTGRPHQIRIHLAAVGHPLVGDPLYPAGGVPAASCQALPGDPGYRLHAAELRFAHPVTGSQIVVRCPSGDPALGDAGTAGGRYAGSAHTGHETKGA